MDKDLIYKRLESLGYICTNDDWAIEFCIEKVLNHIKSVCNTSEMSQKLSQIAVDMVCAEFLSVLEKTGKLDELFNLEMAVKSVKAGDTNVSFDTAASPSVRFDALLEYLNRGRGDLLCYRKLKW